MSMYASDPAGARQAMAAGMAAARERQDFYMAHPEGVTVPGDDPSWHPQGPSPVPQGLGMLLPPDQCPVFVGPEPGLVPSPVTPAPVTAGPSWPLSGTSHGGWGVPAAAPPMGDVFYMGVPSSPRPSLWARLFGRRR